MFREHTAAEEYDTEVNLRRARLRATVDALQTNIRPGNLADEVARGSGLDGWSAASVFDAAIRRHPAPTALIGVGIAVWAFSKLRGNAKAAGGSGLSHSLHETATSLGQSATNVLRERAEKKRREFVGVAKSHIETGITGLADAIERKVEDVIDVVPEASGVRPLVSSAIKVLLLSIVEGMIAKA